MQPSTVKNTRILTIEDDSAVRVSIKAHLEDYGYTVFEAENGEKGIKSFESENPDAILVDLKMPGISGIDVIREIHNDDESVPLIVVSGTGEIQSAIDAIHVGACDYILKPISDMKILTNSIETCLKRNRKLKAENLYRQHLEDELNRKSVEIERKNRLITEFNHRIKKIIKSSFSTSTASKMKDFSNQILDDFGAHLNASGGSVYMLEESGLRLVNSIEQKHAPDFITFPLIEGSPFKMVLENGKPILVDNIDSESGMTTSGWGGYKDSSFMIFPLPDHNGNTVGILSLHNKTVPPFVSEDKEIGQLMSSFYQEAIRSVTSMEALQLSESRLDKLTENSEAIIFSYSIDAQVFNYINNAFEVVTGFEKEAVLKKNIENYIQRLGIIDTEDFISHFESLITGQSSGNGIEYRIRTSAGNEKWFFQKSVSTCNIEGFPTMIDGIITEFTQQKEAEQKLQALVDQKDLLLKEINHRVKNNMQIISSLINLQADRYDDEKGKRSLHAADERIATLAMVHDNIYNADIYSSIEMSNYIEKLIEKLSERKKPAGVTVDLVIDNIIIDLDRAVLCGLIINEAVNNVFTHAFTKDSTGKLKLNFKAGNDNYLIKIEDNGKGFTPIPEGSKSAGLGLEIIHSLVTQLHGKVDIKNDSGTTVLISFPKKNHHLLKEFK